MANDNQPKGSLKLPITHTELVWEGKYDEQGRPRPVERIALPFQTIEVINDPRERTLFSRAQGKEEGWRNKLIWGDNKYVMASLLENFAGKIDLIYIDPPFATGADFSINMRLGDAEWTKEASIIEEKAYRDTWGKGLDSYLQMLYGRLVLMKDLLSDTGSIYVHLDWHVGHYVKIIMDEIMGKENFLNEIVWKRYAAHSLSTKRYDTISDHILLYAKNAPYVQLRPQLQHIGQGEIEKRFPHVEKETGRRYQHAALEKSANRSSRGEVRIIQGRRVTTNIGWIWSQETLDERLAKNPYLIYWTGEGRPRYKIYADEYKGRPLGNVWDDIAYLSAGDTERVGFDTQKPEALLERIIKASSNEGDLVADFFCGSGTTLAVAEKLGRRWIGCDLSRFAIQVTRKRLLDIPDCKPFEVLNLGKYERQYWQMNIMNGKQKDGQRAIYEYLKFIVKLYQAQPAVGFAHLHGKKAGRMVHVGAVDAPVTFSEVDEALKECKDNGIKALDVLGWDWEMGLHDMVKMEAANMGIDLRLLHIPREVMDKRAVEAGDVHFYELAHLELEVKQNKLAVSIALKNFAIPSPELIPPEVRDKVKRWSDYIDFWAVDWDYRNDTFHNQWQSFRTRKHPTLELQSEQHYYQEAGTYKILVKVIDIFGNDTTKLLEVRVP